MRRLPLRSPPRVRGKVTQWCHQHDIARITPAYAGKRAFIPRPRPTPRDHPRVCGEKSFYTKAEADAKGSPPRMRGKEWYLQGENPAPGITPAYAGKSSRESDCCNELQDHPRVCGEKVKLSYTDDDAEGSPPRMRGKGLLEVFVPEPLRITPAYAGKSARRQAGPPGPAPPPQMRLGWSPPPCTGRQCRTRKSIHARRARIPAPAHTPAPQ